MESAPHLYSPDVANKPRVGCSDPAVHMGTDGKGHNGCTSYSSSGVLIKEDEQKTIAGSLLPESQILECRLKGVSRGWNVWALVRGGG